MTSRNGRPVTVTLQVTDRCNYACVHCYQEHIDHDELSFDEIVDILRQLADAGVLFLTLMGGELFMRRDADDILRTAHDMGFALKIKTTGHHIHDRRADFLATLRPLQADLSLYAATPHLHEAVTRQEGSWQRTFDAAKRLIERKIPVQLNAPIMEINAEDVGNIARLADELGAEFSLDPKITSMENGDQSTVASRMSGKTLEAFYRGDENGLDDYVVKAFGRIHELGDRARPLDHTPCRAGQQTLSIGPRGEVKPCSSLPLVCGDLRTQSFEEIWNGSKELEHVRGLRWATIPECNVCEVRAYCQRCHGMAMLEQGEIRGPSLEACRHAVAVRDSLRDRGILPETHTAMPPTWDRVDPDGQHRTGQHRASPDSSPEERHRAQQIRRSAALRVLG